MLYVELIKLIGSIVAWEEESHCLILISFELAPQLLPYIKETSWSKLVIWIYSNIIASHRQTQGLQHYNKSQLLEVNKGDLVNNEDIIRAVFKVTKGKFND